MASCKTNNLTHSLWSYQGTIGAGGHARLVGKVVSARAHEAELKRVVREVLTAVVTASLAASVRVVEEWVVRQLKVCPVVAVATLVEGIAVGVW